MALQVLYTLKITSHHATLLTGDDLIRKFWDTEEKHLSNPMLNLTVEEQVVIKHFETHYSRRSDGRFMVPLPRKPYVPQLGKSRSQAVGRFLSFEHTLHSRGQFEEVKEVINENFEAKLAEEVPESHLDKPPHEVVLLTHTLCTKRVKHHHQDQGGIRHVSHDLHWSVSERYSNGRSHCSLIPD